MRRALGRVVTVIAWTGASLTAPLAPGLVAQPPAPDSPLFTEQVDVRVVNVEVVVTDRDRRRVGGLGRDDFRLFVDGRETPIDYFSEIVAGFERTGLESSRVTSKEGEPSAASRDAVRDVDRSSVEDASRRSTSIMLFIDEEHVLRGLRDRVLEEMREQLSSLGEQDRFSLVVWSGKKLETLVDWTSSAPEIEAALDAAAERKAWGIRAVSERARRSREPFGQQSGSSTRALRFERAIGAAVSALRLQREVEGRKAALIVTSEWPNGWMRLSNDHVQAVQAGSDDDWTADVPDWMMATEGVARRSFVNSVELLKPLVDTANRLGFTLYPISAAGPSGGSNDNLAERDAWYGGWFDDAAGATGGALGAVAVSAPRDSRLPEWQQLRFLADATGGMALLADRRFDALSLAIEDTRSYYSLGFTWTFRQDGLEHRIRVVTRREDLEVRSRSSFRDSDLGADQELDVRAAMITEPDLGAEPAVWRPEVEGLRLHLGEPVELPRRLVRVPLQISVPAADIAFLRGPDGLRYRLELRLAAVDRSGAQSEIPVVHREGEVREKPWRIVESVPLTLRRRRHRVVVSVRDPVGGETFTATVHLDADGWRTEPRSP